MSIFSILRTFASLIWITRSAMGANAPVMCNDQNGRPGLASCFSKIAKSVFLFHSQVPQLVHHKAAVWASWLWHERS